MLVISVFMVAMFIVFAGLFQFLHFGQRRFGWWVEAPARTLLFGKLAPVLSDLLHALLMLHAGILQSKLCHPFFDEEVEGRYPPALRQSPQAAVNPSHGMFETVQAGKE